jgi:hypothetical protein
MTAKIYDVPVDVITGLPLEYQGNYGTAQGDLNVLDLINNPEANGLCRVYGMGLSGEGLDLASAQDGLTVAGGCGGRFPDSPAGISGPQDDALLPGSRVRPAL